MQNLFTILTRYEGTDTCVYNISNKEQQDFNQEHDWIRPKSLEDHSGGKQTL